jgi:hypothetical protein
MNATLILRIVIIAYTAVFAIYWIADCIKHKEEFTPRKPLQIAAGQCILKGVFMSIRVLFICHGRTVGSQ